MRTGISFRIVPLDEPRPENLAEVYDELWDLAVANVQALVKGKAARDVARVYLPDSRTDGWSDAEEVTFAFYEGEGCSLSSALCRHWLRVSLSVMREGLNEVIAPLGYELAPLPDVEEIRASGDRFMAVKGIAYRVEDESGELRLWRDGETLVASELSKAIVRKARTVLDGPTCLCELCRKLDAGKGPTDPVALRAAEPASTEFTSVSKALRHVRHARSLALYERHLTELPEEIGRLTWLTTLYVWDNLLKELPATLGQLRRLETLHAGGNAYLARIAPELGELERLERLDLSGAYSLRELPSSLRGLRRLKSLDLGRTALTEVPDWFAELESLEVLSLYGVPLQAPPEVLVRLPKLRQLDLRDTAPAPFLDGVDAAAIEKYRGAEALLRKAAADGLGDAWLEFPFDRMPALESVQLRGVSAMPPALRRCRTLTSLDVSDHPKRSPLPQLPEWIGELERLERLQYGASDTTEWPAGLFELERLTHLTLSNARLESIPAAIGQMQQLVDLRLNGSPLAAIADELAGCRAIQYLGLADHRLDELPPALRELPALKMLWD